MDCKQVIKIKQIGVTSKQKKICKKFKLNPKIRYKKMFTNIARKPLIELHNHVLKTDIYY